MNQLPLPTFSVDRASFACDMATAALLSDSEAQGDVPRPIQLLRTRSFSLAACDSATVPTAGGGAALYAIIVRVGNDDVAIWVEDDALSAPQFPGTCSFPLATDHCGAIPAASCGAAQYPKKIASVDHDEVTFWGDGNSLWRNHSPILADCGATPAANGGAAQYLVCACARHEQVTIWGEGGFPRP